MPDNRQGKRKAETGKEEKGGRKTVEGGGFKTKKGKIKGGTLQPKQKSNKQNKDGGITIGSLNCYKEGRNVETNTQGFPHGSEVRGGFTRDKPTKKHVLRCRL